MKKKYLLCLITVIISVIVFDRIFANLINNFEINFYKKKNFKEKFIEYKRDTYNTLILGSSRTKRSIFPIYLYEIGGLKAKNIARNACSAKFNYYFYKEYKKYAKLPKLIIYGVDYFIFNLRSNPRWMQYFSGKDINHSFEPGGILKLIRNKNRIDILLNNFINTVNEEVSKNFRNEKENLPIIDDFKGIKGSISADKNKPDHFKRYPFKKFPGREGAYFKKLLEELNRDGVTVILVYIPEYIGTYESNFQRQLFHESIISITKPFGNIHILDYDNPTAFPLDEKRYFVDGGYGNSNSHMSEEGAKRFNILLIRDIKKILYEARN